jgi:hypothetical protein
VIKIEQPNVSYANFLLGVSLSSLVGSFRLIADLSHVLVGDLHWYSQMSMTRFVHIPVLHKKSLNWRSTEPDHKNSTSHIAGDHIAGSAVGDIAVVEAREIFAKRTSQYLSKSLMKSLSRKDKRHLESCYSRNVH